MEATLKELGAKLGTPEITVKFSRKTNITVGWRGYEITMSQHFN